MTPRTAGATPAPSRVSLPVRSRIALAAARVAGWASRTTGRGAGVQMAGRVALALAPGLVRQLAAGRTVCVVAGTNGKTTTTRLIAAALESAGRAVATNTTGANMASGIVAGLARSAPDAVAVLEVDEATLPLLLEDLAPRVLLLLNLSRDQLDRYGEVRTVARQWREAIAGHVGGPAGADLQLVANADDPLVAWAAGEAGEAGAAGERPPITWVAAGGEWRQDAASCPSCGALLSWDDGSYACVCGLRRPASEVHLSGGHLMLGEERVPLALALPGAWNRANAALAVAAAAALGIPPGAAAEAAATVTEVGGRYARITLADGRSARILLAKNPAGWAALLGFLAGRSSGVVIAVNARAADGRDPSWLWDVPFEVLRGRSVAAAGERAADVAVRLHYAEVPAAVDREALRAAARIGGEEVDIVASYTVFTSLATRLGAGSRPAAAASRESRP